jgi:LL-diaminopimelate aminotransferase
VEAPPDHKVYRRVVCRPARRRGRLSEQGLAQTQKNVAYYLENAGLIAKTLDELGIWYVGGKNSPYIWLRCPGGMGSWEYFDYLLNEANVITTPGAGFGKQGEGFLRLTAFGSRERVIEALQRIRSLQK